MVPTFSPYATQLTIVLPFSVYMLVVPLVFHLVPMHMPLLLWASPCSLVLHVIPTSHYAVVPDLDWSCDVVPVDTTAQPCLSSLIPVLVLSLNYLAMLLS